MEWFFRVVLIAFGVAYIGLGVAWLARFAHGRSRQGPGMRGVVLLVFLRGVHYLGTGLGFAVFGLTLSRIALGCGCVFLLSEIPIRWLTRRRVSQLDPAP